MEEHEYLTREKYQRLVDELDYLKKTKRKEVAEQLEYAKSMGDLAENAEYHEARDMQGVVEDRIQKLESILKSATIVSTHGTEKVGVGSVVTVIKNGTDGQKVYTIVGAEEADVASGKLSMHSPFGEAILGKKKSESFTVEAPSGTVSYKIIEIK